jgi:2-polyprenyl-3-methyl-5-hydroxy-6-metoxy-1,4-benzoquinol methylase
VLVEVSPAKPWPARKELLQMPQVGQDREKSSIQGATAPEMTINKTMDFMDLTSDRARSIRDELNDLIVQLASKNLKVSSWDGTFNLEADVHSSNWINRGYGYKPLPSAADDTNFPWFLYWEIAWLTINNDFRPGDRVLDLGGSSSLFSYYLASKGLEVTAIDIDEGLIQNGNAVSRQMGWNLRNYAMDMAKMTFDSKFDHITSVCVYEHLPIRDRIATSKRVRDLLVHSGGFSITFDYRNPSRKASINSSHDLYEQVIRPSGLRVRGNLDFFDNGVNYLLHPFYYRKRQWKIKIDCIRRGRFSPLQFFKTKRSNDYTFGAIFLQK